MTVTDRQILGYRLWAHHLDKKGQKEKLLDAAGACGLQNTPPGAWETALFNRLENCTREALQHALYHDKTLLQAWSYRGVPVVFPTGQSDVFLTPLIAQEGEAPWIYTRGITGALEYLQMPFDDLLARTMKAVQYLDSHTVKSKEALDQTLADVVLAELPAEKRELWCAPSMYGNPDRQTVGGAAVSFLLRPCAFHSLVVFGERQGASPTFTSLRNWVGREPALPADAEKQLVRKFLHCYGPATVDFFADWLGCTGRQARRLWHGVADEMVPVAVAGKTHYMLAADCADLCTAGMDAESLVLLGAHDPYLDLRDRELVLPDKARQKLVWQFVANPGAVLKGGRIIGVWKAKTRSGKMDVAMQVWEEVTTAEQKMLRALAGEYAAFRLMEMQGCAIKPV